MIFNISIIIIVYANFRIQSSRIEWKICLENEMFYKEQW